MKRKTAALLLVFVLILGCFSISLADKENADAKDSGALRFGEIRNQMTANNTNMLVMQMSIDMLENMDYDGLMKDMRDGLNSIADYQWMITSAQPITIPGLGSIPVTDNYTADKLNTQYDALREQFDDMKDGKTEEDNKLMIKQLKSGQNQLVQAGETLFVTYKSLEVQYNALLRQGEALDRTIKELEVRRNYGQISDLVLAQTESGMAQLESGANTLKMNMDNLLLQYKLMLGMDMNKELKLGSVPSVTQSQLDAMNLEKDFAESKANSYELANALNTYQDAETKYKDDKKDYAYSDKASDKLSWQRAETTWKSAQYTYQSVQDNYELKFRTLYSDVNNKSALLRSAEKALEAEEQNCAASRIKYSYGQISENALLSEEDTLKEKQDSVKTASYDLFTAYNNYQYAVKYGILN